MTSNDIRKIMDDARQSREASDRLVMSIGDRNIVATFQVYDGGSMPTTVPAWFACHPVTLSGTEREGQPWTATPDTTKSVAVLFLNTVPSVGDVAKAVHTGGHWVARKRTAGTPPPPTVVLTGCTCNFGIPTSLTMTVSGPCGTGVFNPCTIAYGPTPTALSGLDLGPNCFLSTATFTDPFSGDFRYALGCDTIFFRLSRVYLSPPFHDTSIFSWSIGVLGNTCARTGHPSDPFRLLSGSIYPGGSPLCIVQITG